MLRTDTQFHKSVLVDARLHVTEVHLNTVEVLMSMKQSSKLSSTERLYGKPADARTSKLARPVRSLQPFAPQTNCPLPETTSFCVRHRMPTLPSCATPNLVMLICSVTGQ